MSGLSLAGPPGLRAAEAELSEYQVKPAYLFNCMTFTEWPANTDAELRPAVEVLH